MLEVTARVLTAAATDGHNTFDAPEAVVPVEFKDFSIESGTLKAELPAKSVTILALRYE